MPTQAGGTQSALEPAPCIFTEDWWFEAASPGAWGRVAVEQDSVVLGEMKFVSLRRLGMTELRMPPMTGTASPKIYTPAGKSVTQRVKTASIVAGLMQRLPRHDRFETSLAPDCPSLQGFVQCECAVTHAYTYRAPRGVDPETLLGSAHQKTRNIVMKARKTLAVERSADLDRFIRLHAARHGRRNRLDYAVLSRLFAAAQSRSQAEILFACAEGQGDTAAAILIWDAATVYFWVAARDPEAVSNGGNSLLIFEALRFAYERGLQLDLDGYGRPQGSLFLMKFGFEPMIRPFVNSSTPLWGLLHAVSVLGQPGRWDRHVRV